MSITIYPSQFNMRKDGSYVQLPAIKGEEGQQGPPGIGSITGGTKGQVPVKQSGTDYDVAWEDIGWQLVWENADTSSAFAAQTVTLDLESAKEVMLVVRAGTYWSGYINCVLSEFGYDYGILIPSYDGRADRRNATLTRTGIIFASNYYKNTYAAGSDSTDNKRVIPFRIYAR